MIETRSELKDWLQYEHKLLWGEQSRKKYILEMVKHTPQYRIGRYMRYLRIAGYYYTRRQKDIACALLYLWFCRRKNILGRKLGIELEEYSFERGLTIYHTDGIVVNGYSRIGKNCKLHGNNCIGNNGLTGECPRLGDNVRLGVGAKVIGGVEIADDITIAAGAVVVHSFTEKGITIGGIPARKIKERPLQGDERCV